MERPKIQVAIPKQRYQLGSYQAVVLGEIESGDARRYQYILALVKQDETQPGFYVTAEKNPRAQAHEGAYRLRVMTEGLSEELGSSDRWGDIDAFAAEGLALAADALGLGSEQPMRQM